MFNWQLLYQEIRWPVSRDHTAGSGLELVFFEVDRWPSAGFRSDRGLNLLKTGLDCSEAVNANPGLKVNQIITFSLVQFFLLLCFVFMVIIKTHRRPNSIQKNLNAKLHNSKQNSTFSWVGLIVLWSTWPWSYAFGWPKSKYWKLKFWNKNEGSPCSTAPFLYPINPYI